MGKPNAQVIGTPGRTHEFGYAEGTEGMTIRQYFMAHAPAEPQQWFKPVVGPRPTMPDKYKELTFEQQKLWADLEGEFADDRTVDGYAVNAFDYKWRQAREACEAYDAEYVRQRYAQWPAVWADAVLAAGEK